MTQPYDGTTRPEGSDAEEWFTYMSALETQAMYQTLSIAFCREISAAIEAARADERERCAKIAEEAAATNRRHMNYEGAGVVESIVGEIRRNGMRDGIRERARGNK